MAKDPAFLFYPGDWQGGTATYSRHLKGCYLDILIAQFNSGPLSIEEIKIVLGTDFAVWGALTKKFKTTENGLFFNERLELEKTKRKEYSKSRKDNINKRYNKSTHVDTCVEHMNVHMENENRNKDKDLNITSKSEKEKKSTFGIGGNVKLTKSEYDRLDIELGSELFIQCIDFLSSYKREKDYKTKDDNLTIRRWVIQAVMEKKKSIQKINNNGEKISKNKSIRASAEEAKRLIREDIANANTKGEECY